MYRVVRNFISSIFLAVGVISMASPWLAALTMQDARRLPGQLLREEIAKDPGIVRFLQDQGIVDKGLHAIRERVISHLEQQEVQKKEAQVVPLMQTGATVSPHEMPAQSRVLTSPESNIIQPSGIKISLDEFRALEQYEDSLVIIGTEVAQITHLGTGSREEEAPSVLALAQVMTYVLGSEENPVPDSSERAEQRFEEFFKNSSVPLVSQFARKVCILIQVIRNSVRAGKCAPTVGPLMSAALDVGRFAMNSVLARAASASESTRYRTQLSSAIEQYQELKKQFSDANEMIRSSGEAIIAQAAKEASDRVEVAHGWLDRVRHYVGWKTAVIAATATVVLALAFYDMYGNESKNLEKIKNYFIVYAEKKDANGKTIAGPDGKPVMEPSSLTAKITNTLSSMYGSLTGPWKKPAAPAEQPAEQKKDTEKSPPGFFRRYFGGPSAQFGVSEPSNVTGESKQSVQGPQKSVSPAQLTQPTLPAKQVVATESFGRRFLKTIGLRQQDTHEVAQSNLAAQQEKVQQIRADLNEKYYSKHKPTPPEEKRRLEVARQELREAGMKMAQEKFAREAKERTAQGGAASSLAAIK